MCSNDKSIKPTIHSNDQHDNVIPNKLLELLIQSENDVLNHKIAPIQDTFDYLKSKLR